MHVYVSTNLSTNLRLLKHCIKRSIVSIEGTLHLEGVQKLAHGSSIQGEMYRAKN